MDVAVSALAVLKMKTCRMTAGMTGRQVQGVIRYIFQGLQGEKIWMRFPSIYWLTAVFSPPTMQLDILIFSQILDATMGSIERIPQVDIAILFGGNVFVLYVEVRMKLNWETNGNSFGELYKLQKSHEIAEMIEAKFPTLHTVDNCFSECSDIDAVTRPCMALRTLLLLL